MREPLHDLGCALGPQSLRQLRRPDHDHRQAQRARGIDLGARTLPAGVARHDPFDPTRTHQLEFAGQREWPARDDEIGIRQRQRPPRSVDEAERVGMLRHGCERRNMLPADREKDIAARFGQRRYGGRDVIHIDPAIVSRLDPRLALERDQRRGRRYAGRQGVLADFGCKRMGRVDHMRESFPPNKIGKPVRTAEAANAGRQRLIDRYLCSAGIGIGGVKPRSRNLGRQPIGFARSTQDENAHG